MRGKFEGECDFLKPFVTSLWGRNASLPLASFCAEEALREIATLRKP